MKELRPTRGYAVAGPGGWIIPSTVRWLRKEAIAAFMQGDTQPWSYYRARGFQAVRVTVTAETQP